MAGSLIKIDEYSVSSAVASVTIGGGSSGSSGLNTAMDSTYDVYVVTVKNLKPVTNQVYPYMRFTVSGSPQATAEYDYGDKNIKQAAAFSNMANSNQTAFLILSEQIGTGTEEEFNAIFYIYNSNLSGEFTYMTQETTGFDHNGNLLGSQGGGVYTVQNLVDGANFFMASGNIASGDFVLYGLVK